MESSYRFKIALIGATGAIGKEIVKWAMDPTTGAEVEEMTLIVRRQHADWKKEAEANPGGPYATKLRYVIRKNYDDLTDLAQQLQGYDIFLCTLGSRTGQGKEIFKKVDYQYPLNFAELAKQLQIPHYGLLSSSGAKSSSWFLYMKTKGQIQDAICALDLNQVVIYKPGVLVARDNDFRLGEWIFSKIPFVPKMSSTGLGFCMLHHSIRCLKEHNENKVIDLSNSQLNTMLKELQKKKK